MKKIASLMTLLFIISLPALAAAGTAYIPLFVIETPAAPDLEYVLTAFQVNNISSTEQNVKITFTRDDGTPLANQPITMKNGGVLQTTPETTDAKGEISVTLGALKTLQVVLKKVDGAPFVQGHGRITGSPIADGVPGFLVANGIIRDSNYYNGDYVYLRAITINGGNPF